MQTKNCFFKDLHFWTFSSFKKECLVQIFSFYFYLLRAFTLVVNIVFIKLYKNLFLLHSEGKCFRRSQYKRLIQLSVFWVDFRCKRKAFQISHYGKILIKRNSNIIFIIFKLRMLNFLISCQIKSTIQLIVEKILLSLNGDSIFEIFTQNKRSFLIVNKWFDYFFSKLIVNYYLKILIFDFNQGNINIFFYWADFMNLNNLVDCILSNFE